jgi:hypothetical protein
MQEPERVADSALSVVEAPNASQSFAGTTHAMTELKHSLASAHPTPTPPFGHLSSIEM